MSNKKAVEVFSDWADSYLNFERTPKKNIFWLDTIDFLCKRFGNPQESFKSIHVAGSKGKGSVSVMISSIIEEYGYKCGLYTSPHIVSLAERIGTAAGELDESIYEEALKELMPRVESIIPDQLPNEREITWFELITIYAFLCFRKAGLKYAVLETGMGGRLDSTNIVMPEASVITPIELEHTEFLGDTIEQIASEKAGIIKKKIPVFVAKQKPEALQVFKEKASAEESHLYYIADEVKSVSYKLPENTENPLMHIKLEFNRFFSSPIETDIRLIGKTQAENASLAALVTKVLFPDITEETIEKGLSKAKLPGRFEITQNPYCTGKKLPVIMDGAHTPNSLAYTLETFSTIFPSNPAHLLFGCAQDKKMSELVKLLLKNPALFNKISLTKPGCHKQSSLPELVSAFEAELKRCKDEKIAQHSNVVLPEYKSYEDYTEAIMRALFAAAAEETPLLVTGSFYLVSEVKKVLSASESSRDGDSL